MARLLTHEQQTVADRLAGQYDTLADRARVAEYKNELSHEEVSELRAEMDALSSEYFDLTGEVLR